MRSIIIPAAGLASRMKPLSRGISKAMIPVNGRPLISYVIEQIFLEQDVNEVVIVENEIKDIQEFVSRVYKDLPIKCVQQGEKLGPLHAISIGHSALEKADNEITIWLGDTICLDSLPYGKDFLAVYGVEDPHRWCLVDEDGILYDKPDSEVSTNNALIGIYNFVNREKFDKAIVAGMKKPQHKGEHQIAGLLEAYMKRGPMSLVKVKEWYDCGELNTYYESKARLLQRTARTFNKIEVNTFYGTVTKSSTDAAKQYKIECEKNWFQGLKEHQSLFCPRILESEEGVLKMTLEPGTPLNEVLVYDNLRKDIWHDIIRKILKVHHDVFYGYEYGDLLRTEQREACFKAYFLKNDTRMAEISDMFGHMAEVTEFVESTSLELCRYPIWSACMHGDSHLGNIIYDPHSGNLKFVDPRGSFGGLLGNQGDLRYDMAKLLQDFYCGYAMIMANRYTWKTDEEVEIDWAPGTEDLSEFLEAELKGHGYDVKILKRLAIVLLITAIPFHSDSFERQQALYYRGLNLIKKLNKNNKL